MKLKSGPSMDLLKAKLDSVLSESIKKQAETMNEITSKGKRIPIKNDKLRLSILNFQEIDYELQQADVLDKKLGLYDKLFIAYNDSMRIIKDDLEAGSSGKSKSLKAESQEDNLHALKIYVSYLKLSKTIERNLLLVDSLQSNLFGRSGEVEAPVDVSKKRTKPDDLVRVYETLIHNMTEMADLRASEDAEQAKEIAAKIFSFKALRCYYMALSYLFNSKWKEALSLLDRAMQLLRSARAHHEACAVINQEYVKKLKETENNIRGFRCEAHARGFLESIRANQTVNQQVPKESPSKSLISQINKFDSSFEIYKQLIPFPPDF